MSKTITQFIGQYSFLSNFYPSTTCPPTVEHHFQAAKCFDLEASWRILNAKTPGKAKQLGRQCLLRKDWESVKDKVMLDLLRAKFEAPDLRAKLLATKDWFLIEGNDWGDRYWGKSWSVAENNWVGENKLGQLLMQVRTEIRLEFEGDV